MEKQHFLDFLKRFWWWNLAIDLVILCFGMAMIEALISSWEDVSSTMTLMYFIVVIFWATAIHAVFLFVVLVRHLIKKNWWIAIALIANIGGIFAIGYLYFLLTWASVFSWFYSEFFALLPNGLISAWLA